MIYQQQTAVADAPATTETAVAVLGLSSSFFCAAAVAITEVAVDLVVETVAASSGFCFFSASVATETADGADVEIASANIFPPKGVGEIPTPFSFYKSFKKQKVPIAYIQRRLWFYSLIFSL